MAAATEIPKTPERIQPRDIDASLGLCIVVLIRNNKIVSVLKYRTKFSSKTIN
jgi:hypothetical protein